MPGEISLAHNGVLFLDESLSLKCSPVIGQPLEDESYSFKGLKYLNICKIYASCSYESYPSGDCAILIHLIQILLTRLKDI